MCKESPENCDLQSLSIILKFKQLLPSGAAGMEVVWRSRGRHATASRVWGTPSETRMTERRGWRGSMPTARDNTHTGHIYIFSQRKYFVVIHMSQC